MFYIYILKVIDMLSITHFYRIYSYIIKIIICVPIIILFQSYGYNITASEKSFAYHPEFSFSGPFMEKVRWKGAIEPTLTSNEQQPDMVCFIGGFSYKINEKLSIVPQIQYTINISNFTHDETRSFLDIIYKHNVEGFYLDFRNRVEYRMKENSRDLWRNRFRIKIGFLKKNNIKPFIYDEVYYETRKNKKINANDMGLGLALPIDDKLKLIFDLRLHHSRVLNNWTEGALNFYTVFIFSF